MFSASLIGITKPTQEMIDDTGAECAADIIAYCARVSNPANQENFDTAEKLLLYCMDNHHWSVFETCHATMEIVCTRDIGRQILRHRSFSYQEFSQRYAKVLADPVIRECRFQDPKNRQNSVEIDFNNPEHVRIAAEWAARQQAVIDFADENYQWALENNIAKEQARVILPEGNTVSTMYMAGSIRSWIHYALLRLGNGTQKEHTWIAADVWKILENEFPFLRGLDVHE